MPVSLFRVTETYRAGAEGKDKTERLLHATYELLQDMLYLNAGLPELARNSDISQDLARLASTVDFDWIERASQQLDEVNSGMRRNLLRSLSLDAMVAGLESD